MEEHRLFRLLGDPERGMAPKRLVEIGQRIGAPAAIILQPALHSSGVGEAGDPRVEIGDRCHSVVSRGTQPCALWYSDSGPTTHETNA